MLKDESTLSARDILKKERGEIRTFRKFEQWLVYSIAISWSLFQLAVADFVILNSTYERAIHLAFAITLLFLTIPCIKKPLKKIKFLSFLSVSDHIPILDYLLALTACCAALYLAVDYQGIGMRLGIPLSRDLIIGVTLVILLLEAARRSIGPALPVIAIFFTLYAFLGPHMPDFMAFKGVSLTKYLSNITLSTEGIYGIPLGVSSSIVFLFVLLGALLDKAGAGKFFTDLALSFLGKYKGGAAKAAVVASGATGLISGSSIANIVTTGPFTIPLMKKIGYPAKKAAAIEVASSTDGQLMPPIMGAAAFIIAEYVNVPYLEVVKAAAIPAFVSYFGLFCITHLEASKHGIKGLAKKDIPIFLQTLKQGLHYLIPIGVLLYELIYKRHTPLRAAYKAIILIFIVILYQEIRESFKTNSGFAVGLKNGVKIIFDGLAKGSRNMISVALACAAAGIIVGIVNMGIGGMISDVVEYLSRGNLFLLLFITAMASLLIGMGLPTTATYIVMASLTAPIIVNVGGSYGYVIPIMAAHLFCFYFGILADDTPPVGLAAYAASAIAESKPIPTGIQGFLYDIRTSVIAFMFVINPELILHNINSWPQALLIFGMALVGMSCFECCAQAWFLIRIKWYEIPLLLSAAFVLFHPGAIATYLNIDQAFKYYLFPIGLVLFGIAFALQKWRMANMKNSKI